MLPVIASATRPAVGYITGDCVLMHVRYLLTRSFLYAYQLSERFIEDRKIQLDYFTCNIADIGAWFIIFFLD